MVTEKDGSKDPEKRMVEQGQIDEILASLKALTTTNQTLVQEVAELKKDNIELKKKGESRVSRVEANKAAFEERGQEVLELLRRMETLKDTLLEDNVEEEYFSGNGLSEICEVAEKLHNQEIRKDAYLSRKVKQEPVHALIPEERFKGTAKEERMECYFGEDGNYSSVAMRRFAERYETVREMNVQLKIAGWDDPTYRAGKITLCLKGDAFDFVKFAKASHEEWASRDDSLLAKLQDKFINIQAVEMNILHFEQSVQEPKESVGEYMSRLRRAVREAYDGDAQSELDRKVAWRFVSGVSEKRVRDKILESGWMQNRREAKPLEELEKIAEYTKRSEDASKAMSRSSGMGNVAAFQEEDMIVSAFNRRNSYRSKTPSAESKGSSGSKGSGSSSSDLPLDFALCWYCKQSHRGGWFYCSKRKKESPGWKPNRGDGKGRYPPNSKKDFH